MPILLASTSQFSFFIGQKNQMSGPTDHPYTVPWRLTQKNKLAAMLV